MLVVKNFVNGSVSVLEIFKRYLGMAILTIIMFALAIAPGNFLKLFKTTMSLGNVINSSSVTAYNYLYSSDATTEEKSDLMYWMPYYNSWVTMETGHSADSDELKINESNAANEPEQNQISYPKFSGEDSKNWGVLLLNSFSKKNGVVSNSAYRVVDHLMAPRMTIKNTDGKYSITTTANENYNGVKIGTGKSCYFLATLPMTEFQIFKTIWFLGLVIEFMVIFIISLSKINSESDSTDAVKNELNGFVVGIVEYLVFCFMTPLSFQISMKTGGEFITAFPTACVFIAVGFFIFKSFCNFKIKPAFLSLFKFKR
jgi:uncharacterized membrane protein